MWTICRCTLKEVALTTGALSFQPSSIDAAKVSLLHHSPLPVAEPFLQATE
jgi:hypothetical protein